MSFVKMKIGSKLTQNGSMHMELMATFPVDHSRWYTPANSCDFGMHQTHKSRENRNPYAVHICYSRDPPAGRHEV